MQWLESMSHEGKEAVEEMGSDGAVEEMGGHGAVEEMGGVGAVEEMGDEGALRDSRDATVEGTHKISRKSDLSLFYILNCVAS